MRLTNDAAAEADLAYAPDGEGIYFTRTEQGATSVWRIGALGAQARRAAGDARMPAPSPDGRRLAYYGQDREGPALLLSASDGSGARVLTRAAPAQIPTLAWSPDGRQLSFTRGGLFSPANLFAVDVGSGETRDLTRFEGSGQGIHAHQWLPDGKRIVVAYSTDGSGFQNDLGILDVSSGSITRLTLNVAQNVRRLSLSADGSRLLATTLEIRRELWKVPLGADPEANGRGATRLLDDSHDPMWTFVSRDGRTLLYNSSMTGSRNLWTRPLDGSAPDRQITAFPGDAVMHSSLSPDGGRVAFVSRAAGHSDVWTQGIDGSELRQLTNDEAADSWPVWSPDGRSLVYNALRTGRRETWRIGADGGGAEKLLDGFFRGDWIPRPGGEGTLIATANGEPEPRSGVRLVDVERRSVVWERQLAGAGVSLPLFGPDGRSISIAGRETGRDVIWLLDAATGAPRVAVRFAEPFRFYFRASWVDGGHALVVNRYYDVSRIDLIDRISATSPPGR